jgi:hypothetical protein
VAENHGSAKVSEHPRSAASRVLSSLFFAAFLPDFMGRFAV